MDDRSLEVEAEVPGSRISGLYQGRSVDVLPEFGKTFKASVRAVIPEENALSRTRLVRFIPAMDYDPGRVAANQSVLVHCSDREFGFAYAVTIPSVPSFTLTSSF